MNSINPDWSNYLREICSRASLPFDQLTLSEFDHCKTKNEVNKHLFLEVVPRIVVAEFEGLPTDLQTYLAGARFGFNLRQYNSLRTTREATMGRIRDLRTRQNAQLEDLVTTEKQILKMLMLEPSDVMTEELKKILSGHYDFVTQVDPGVLRFQTKSEVVMRHIHQQSGVDIQVNFGKMLVDYNPEHGRIRVLPAPNGVRLGDDYFHPHVDTEGSICWGNADSTYTRAMADFKPAAAFEALWLLLNSYNDDSPYRALFKFWMEQNKDEQKNLPKYKKKGPRVWISESVWEDIPGEIESNLDERRNDDDDPEVLVQTYREYFAGIERRASDAYYLCSSDLLFSVALDDSDIIEEY